MGQNMTNESDAVAYCIERCDAIEKEHGVSISSPVPDVFSVDISLAFSTRAAALRFADKLVAFLGRSK